MCIHSQRVSYFSLVHAWLAFQHRRMISEIEMVCSLYHLWYIPTMCIHLLSDGKLLFTGVCRLRISTQDRSVKLNWSALSSTCGTSWPCAFFYSQEVSYFSLVHAWLEFQHSRIICEIRMVCSLFHLRYILTMCIHFLSAGKLFFPGSYMFSIPTQENDPWNLMVCSSTYGTSWPCAFIHSQEVSYFSLVHA